MKERERRINLGDQSVRGRLSAGKPVDRHDIGHVWMEQNRMAQNRKATRSNNRSFYQRILQSAKKKIISFKTTLVRTKNAKNNVIIKNKLPNIGAWIYSHKKSSLTLGATVVIFSVLFIKFPSRVAIDDPQSLGVTSISGENNQSDDGRTDETPTFKVLYPKDKPKDLTAVTRKTPTGILLHTYADSLEGIEIEITQQELPETFKSAPFVELEKMAKNFQATDVIQIDETMIYHGLDEKTRVQSLFTIKNGTLISIRSAEKLSDDQWASYFLSLE